MRILILFGIFLLLFAGVLVSVISGSTRQTAQEQLTRVWIAPDTSLIPADDSGDLIRYGLDLIVNTSMRLGPKGTVKSISNSLNCQSCHLDAGTRKFGNNFSAVASLYPKFRARSGSVESIEKKISDCFERSMNGRAPDSNSREMKAIAAYLRWIGSGVSPGTRPDGAGLLPIKLLNRAADTSRGATVYMNYCATCHGDNGLGKFSSETNTYTYPPLWGRYSFNTGAGIFRISKMAAFVKSNMPLGVSFEKPLLTDEEAWDVAAFINSRPRTQKQFSTDWPDLLHKPADHPFGPYADSLSEAAHKYGPFNPSMGKLF